MASKSMATLSSALGLSQKLKQTKSDVLTQDTHTAARSLHLALDVDVGVDVGAAALEDHTHPITTTAIMVGHLTITVIDAGVDRVAMMMFKIAGATITMVLKALHMTMIDRQTTATAPHQQHRHETIMETEDKLDSTVILTLLRDRATLVLPTTIDSSHQHSMAKPHPTTHVTHMARLLRSTTTPLTTLKTATHVAMIAVLTTQMHLRQQKRHTSLPLNIRVAVTHVQSMGSLLSSNSHTTLLDLIPTIPNQLDTMLAILNDHTQLKRNPSHHHQHTSRAMQATLTHVQPTHAQSNSHTLTLPTLHLVPTHAQQLLHSTHHPMLMTQRKCNQWQHHSHQALTHANNALTPANTTHQHHITKQWARLCPLPMHSVCSKTTRVLLERA
eukprot:m.183785 g.183785  ORF g.183785 m.183785 type:complete len:386 (-) comp14698_c0_seq1:275-1432(-)